MTMMRRGMYPGERPADIGRVVKVVNAIDRNVSVGYKFEGTCMIGTSVLSNASLICIPTRLTSRYQG